MLVTASCQMIFYNNLMITMTINKIIHRGQGKLPEVHQQLQCQL